MYNENKFKELIHEYEKAVEIETLKKVIKMLQEVVEKKETQHD